MTDNVLRSRATLQEAVAARIAGLGPAVQDAVVDALVARKKNQRVEALTQGIDRLDKFEVERAKLNKKCEKRYNANKEVVSEHFNQSTIDEMNKLDSQIAKLTAALGKALEEGDYGQLLNITKDQGAGGGKGKGGDNPPADEEAE